MARSLHFSLAGESFACEFAKLDRNKLYGWVERKAYDKNGKECYFGSISSDGTHIFGRQSFEQGYLDNQGQWLSSADLKLVDADNQELPKFESTLKSEINLLETVPVDTYLNYVAKSVYELDASPSLLAAVQAQDEIFTFPFNYYASHEPDAAFLIESEGTVFMVIGQHCGFEFLSMQNIEAPVLDDSDEEDDGDIDFSMF